MTSFEQVGETLLLAEEGRRALARELAVVFGRWWSGFREWHAGMPTALPPIEAAGQGKTHA